jgi:hypothetical protein
MGPSWPSVRPGQFPFSLVISGVAGGTREQDEDKIIAFSRSGRLGKRFPSDPGFANLFQKPDHLCRPTVRSQSYRLSSGSSVHHPWHRGSVVFRFTVARPRRRNQTRSVWMGTGPGSRHAKNLMRGTKQRKGECRTQGRLGYKNAPPLPVVTSKLAAQCSPFRRAMVRKRIGLRRKSKSRDFTSPERGVRPALASSRAI